MLQGVLDIQKTRIKSSLVFNSRSDFYINDLKLFREMPIWPVFK